MAKRGVKKKDYERLDDATISRVVLLLGEEKPITKKAACEILNISYNTKRLGNIIQEYNDKIEFTKKRFAANKGQPFSDIEIKEMVVDYLNGDSITNIAASLYRSVHVVKRKLNELNLPERTKKPTYQHPDMIPEASVSELFNVGEVVWSARYNAVAEVHGIQLGHDGWGLGAAYCLWVFGKHNEFAYQPWWELGKLEVVERLGLETEKFVKTQKSTFNYRIE